ncbi:MAG TPA: 3,4-dioxygenase subunit beta [Micromonosporaceae bacterium]|nr:3,4-dioxygenase subunit beta [Micromonosporaceae bacterium]
METELHDHDRGLAFDLSTLLERRRVLGLFGAAGLVTLAGCSTDSAAPGATQGATQTGSATTPAATAGGSCEKIPSETAGPFPGDGSNGPNILTQSGIVRSDIRSSIGTGSATAKGVPLTINLTIQNTGNGCAAYAGAAVYIWHCDMNGLYSMYSPGVTNENYLRGVQEANSSGALTFQSVFPGAYSGRWPHIHFEVYPTLSAATAAGNKAATSQLALPEAVCNAVYATSGYSSSISNMSRTTLQNDGVFRDGVTKQMATVTGDATSGYVASLVVPV